MLGPVGLVLQVAGAVTSVAGVIRLRRLRGRWSALWSTVALAVVLVTALSLAKAVTGL